MGNKIITEEDFWECTGGLMPVPLQSSQRLVYTNGRKAKKYITLADKSTVSWVDFGCKKLMLLYAVIAAVAAAIAALCAATGGAALIAICALAGAAGAMWGAVVGSLLCGQLAAMARVWCSSKDDFQILGINTITGKDTMQCLAFTFIGQNPETITYKPGVKSWSQALATGAANLIGGLFEGMMYGACIGSAFAAGAALAGGASAGGGLAGMGRVALNFIKSIPRNILTNIAESYSAMGMGMRGVMSAQSALTTYGELGDEMTREDLGNAVSRGFWSMETGTYESGKNILTGNGKMEDYMGIALNLTPTGQGAREVFPHNSNYQKMGIVPDNLAGKMDLDGGVKKAPDADGGVKKSVSDDGLPVKKQGSSKSRKPKGKNGKAYEKTKKRLVKIKVKPPFKYKKKFSFSEFLRQLKGQESGMNRLTVKEFLANRDAYLSRKMAEEAAGKKNPTGRSKEGTRAQRKYRKNYRKERIKELEKQGKTPEEAIQIADSELAGKAALHDPDQIAGGHGENITGLGDSDVNSSIGSQWEGERIERIDAEVRKQAENMTPEERANTYLDIELDYE